MDKFSAEQDNSSPEQMKFFSSPVVLMGLICLLVSACGIEDYPYISPVPQSNITRELNSRATVVIPNTNASNNYFTHFTVFYRIYVGENEELSPSKENISAINSVLYSDYIAIEPYIDNDSIGSSSIYSTFSNRQYQILQLENANIENNVLSDSVLGRTIIFDFSQTPGDIPVLIVGGNRYSLWRSNGNGSFTPRPENRYFINGPELYDSTNINSNVNADVVNKPDLSSGAVAIHTYVSMYIVATGLDTQAFTQIFSTPAFIGILRLPDPGTGTVSAE
jgi:hypothetical protein